MRSIRRPPRALTFTLAAALSSASLAACSTSSGGGGSTPSTRTTAAAPSATLPAQPEQAAQIPDCDVLLPQQVVQDALGGTGTFGPNYVRQVAYPGINRTGAVTCSYNLATFLPATPPPAATAPPPPPATAPPPPPPGAPAPPAPPSPPSLPLALDGTLATYADAASAVARINDNLTAFRAKGDTPTQVTVGADQGWMLSDSSSTTVIVADLNRTAVVNVYPPAAGPGTAPAVAVKIAATLLAAPRAAAPAPSPPSAPSAPPATPPAATPPAAAPPAALPPPAPGTPAPGAPAPSD